MVNRREPPDHSTDLRNANNPTLVRISNGAGFVGSPGEVNV